MRNVFVAVSSFFTLMCLPAEDYPPMDIKTIYGQTFKNAQIVNVNTSTVDITYRDNNNTPVMRGVRLKELTPELQAVFGYDPAVAAENERRQVVSRQNQFNQLRLEEMQLQRKLSLQISQRQSGQNIPINLGELQRVIYAGKAAISGYVVAFDKDGALINVTGNDNDSQNIPDNIVILDINVPARSNWTGYIYPTMMVSSQQLPVYCVNPENAFGSVITTLGLDSDMPPVNNTAAAPPATGQYQTAGTATDQYVPATGNYNEYNTYYVQGGGYYYPSYGGNFYTYGIWPAYPPRPRPYPRPPWWHNNCDDDNHGGGNGNNGGHGGGNGNNGGHGGGNGNNGGHGQIVNNDSKWVRRVDENGNAVWLKRPTGETQDRNSQAANNDSKWIRQTDNQGNASWVRRSVADTQANDNSGGRSRLTGPTDLRNDSSKLIVPVQSGSRWSRRTQEQNIGHINSQISNNNSSSGGSRWSRRTQEENIGRINSQISGGTNSGSRNNSDSRWIRSSLDNGNGWSRGADQPQAVVPRSGPTNRSNDSGRQDSNTRPGGWSGNSGGWSSNPGNPGNSGNSGNSGGSRSGGTSGRSAAPVTGSGFTGGTVGAGSWGGGLGR